MAENLPYVSRLHKYFKVYNAFLHFYRSVCLHENSRYLVGFGFKSRENDSQFIFVYDLMANKVVRERVLVSSVFIYIQNLVSQGLWCYQRRDKYIWAIA